MRKLQTMVTDFERCTQPFSGVRAPQRRLDRDSAPGGVREALALAAPPAFPQRGLAGCRRVRPDAHTDQMRMNDVYPPSSREDAILEVPVPFRWAGTWHGEIRARLVDEDGDWFFELRFNTGIAENRVGTFPAAWVRRPELTDTDGIVPPDTLAMMREAGSDA